MSKTLFRKLFSYDASLATFETSNGTMTLPQIFIPFFIEMLLLNLMGTINTFMLSHYSDDAVAAVGSASQILSMVLTLYTVIGTGASIVINHNLGANNKKTASDAAFCSIFFCGFFSLILGTVLATLADTVLGAMHLDLS